MAAATKLSGRTGSQVDAIARTGDKRFTTTASTITFAGSPTDAVDAVDEHLSVFADRGTRTALHSVRRAFVKAGETTPDPEPTPKATETTSKATTKRAGKASTSSKEKAPKATTAKAGKAKADKVEAAPATVDEAKAPKVPAGHVAIDLTSRPIVAEVLAAALTRVPDDQVAGAIVDGRWLVLNETEAHVTVKAITEHMTAIIRENRGANMYRARQLRRIVRPAIYAAFPSSVEAAARPRKEKADKLARVEALNDKLRADRERKEAAKAAATSKAKATPVKATA